MMHRNIPKFRKVMISQPMKGKTKEEIQIERNEMTKLLEKEYGDNYIVLDTTVKDHENKSDLECFSESIGFMSKCDVLVMGVGWSTARGCKLEHDIAKAYNVPILYLQKPFGSE